VIEWHVIAEDHGGLVVQCIHDTLVARAKILGRPRQIRGATQEAEVQLVVLLFHGCQVDAGAMSLRRFDGLGQRLEGVLRADALEVVVVEEAPIVDADATGSHWNPSEIYKLASVVVAVR